MLTHYIGERRERGMNQKESISRQLTKNYVENYMGNVFYFCLKKTGSSVEAEDLTSDISLNIVEALEKGTIPTSFSAWVWQIARNRYSVWAAKKHRRCESVTGADISDYEIEDETLCVEEKFLHREDLSLLRRELAFISSDYRNIVVAYYIEDRKTKDIASGLRLPKGTVESKLFRARKILKEGMSMAREFGPRSYKPEDIYFASSGSQKSSLPWSAVERMLPKNILLEANNNPSTIEELSMELGTAVPYMEEEAELLVRATLLKKLDNKYVTNFFIVSSECQLQIYMTLKNNSKKRNEMIDKIVIDSLDEIRSLGIVKNEMSDNDLKWWALIYAADFFSQCVDGYNILWPEVHPDGDRWGFIGYEKTELPEELAMGHNGTTFDDDGYGFWTYKIRDHGMWNRAGHMDYRQVVLLRDILSKNRKISSFTDSEKDIWRNMENRFAHAEEDGSVTPDILVMNQEILDKIEKILQSHPLYEKVMANLQDVWNGIINILKKNNNPILNSQLAYCASMEILNIRMMTVRDAIEAGTLIVPEDVDHSTAAMWIVLP